MDGDRWISVTAEGEGSVAPDMAVVSLSVSGSGSKLGPTRDDVNTRTSAVLAGLRALGIAEADFDAPDVGIHPEYDHRGAQRLIGYRVSRRVSVRVRDLDRLGDVLDGVVAAGANEVHGAQMSAVDPSAAEHDALRAALMAARAKAEVLADAAGATLGQVMRVEEEPDAEAAPLRRFRATAMVESADVTTEVAAGDLTVTRRISARFEIA